MPESTCTANPHKQKITVVKRDLGCNLLCRFKSLNFTVKTTNIIGQKYNTI